jgi:hypothetical protein
MKRRCGLFTVCALLYGALFFSTSLPDLPKVDDDELARANASVTGAAHRNRKDHLEKEAVLSDKSLNSTLQEQNQVAMPPILRTEWSGLDLRIDNHTTWTYDFNTLNPNYVGSSRGVTTRRQ